MESPVAVAVAAVAVMVVIAARRLIPAAILITLVTIPFVATPTVTTVTSSVWAPGSVLFRFILEPRDLEIYRIISLAAPLDDQLSLTNAPSFNFYSLKVFDGPLAFIDCMILNKAVGGFQGDLSEPSESVKQVKDVALRDFVA